MATALQKWQKQAWLRGEARSARRELANAVHLRWQLRCGVTERMELTGNDLCLLDAFEKGKLGRRVGDTNDAYGFVGRSDWPLGMLWLVMHWVRYASALNSLARQGWLSRRS